MGRKTWESIPEERRPLKGRLNVVLTKQDSIVQPSENVRVFKDFGEALNVLSSDPKVNELFVIGGSSLYEQAFGEMKDHCKLVIATRINKDFECDAFIPNIEKSEHFSPLHFSQTMS